MRRVRRIGPAQPGVTWTCGSLRDLGREYYEVADEDWEAEIKRYHRLVAHVGSDYRGPCPMPEGHMFFEEPEKWGFEQIGGPVRLKGQRERLL
jgi:hypothetical protein